MIKVSRGPNGLDISVPATLENIDSADEETKSFLCRMGLEAEAFGIRLAMREGLLNAVQHGSSGDRDKIIKYSLLLKDNSLVMHIEDEGDGFDWPAYTGKEPTLTSHSGRGLAIMRRYCTEVQYNEKGNKLILTKEVSKRKVRASEVKTQGDVTVVKLRRNMVASVAEEIREELGAALEAPPKELVIDMASVEMVDSAGLAVFNDIHDALSEAGGKLVVINASENVYGVFEALELDQIFTLIRA